VTQTPHTMTIPAPDGFQCRLMRFPDCADPDCKGCGPTGTGWFIFIAPDGEDLWVCTGVKHRYALAPVDGIILNTDERTSLPKVCAFLGLPWERLRTNQGVVLAQHMLLREMPPVTALRLGLKSIPEIREWRRQVEQSNDQDLLRDAITAVDEYDEARR
jgi:hypothetical protein